MSYETIDPAQAKALLDGGEHRYLDVRTEREFRAGHVPGAFNVPLLFRGVLGLKPNPDFLEVVRRHFQPDDKLVVGCAVGGRSAHACELLAQAGFQTLANMDGGYSGRGDEPGRPAVEGWAGRGFPTTTEADSGRSYEALREAAV